MASDWLYSIETAIYLFPVLAMVMTLPFMIYNYRRYGSVPVMRFLCIYLFVFYMLCVYFLVILPLPPVEEVAQLTSPYLNLQLFKDVDKMVSMEPIMPENLQGWIDFLKNWAGLEPLCNVIMLIPFGFFMHYYFKCGFLKTLLYSLLLSAFFELTQLSGLYGIYPRPYRYVDVNDLFNNTLGGCIGWVMMPLLAWVLPSREEIDRNAYSRASANTYTRRLIVLAVDWMAASIVVALVEHWFYEQYWRIVSSACMIVIFTLITYFWNGNTPGKRLLGIRLSRLDGSQKHLPLLSLFLRSAIVYGWFSGVALYPDCLVPDAAMIPGTEIPLLVIAWGVAILSWVILLINMIYQAKKGKRVLFYERLVQICNVEIDDNVKKEC